MNSTVTTATNNLRTIAPGLLIATFVAVAATVSSPFVALVAPVPAMVIALLVGILLNPLAARPQFEAGLTFCIKKLLRWAVALLGLRIALGDIVDLGLGVAALVVMSMAATLIAGIWIARVLGQSSSYGILAGAATAVCGASAALATSTALPGYRGKEAEIAFVVVAVNILSTVAMVVYPLIAKAAGLSDQETGILLGATIHDVAQVVGAGYSVSEEAGNTAVVVKLFRVLLLFPVVLMVGRYFSMKENMGDGASAQVPGFAIAFIVFCIINSIAPGMPQIAEQYGAIRHVLMAVSGWGMLIAISALGLNTSTRAIAGLGWRHMATVIFTSAIIFLVALSGIHALYPRIGP